MCVNLYHREPAEVASNEGVVLQGPHEWREDSMFATEGYGEHIASAPRRKVRGKFVKL
jgi:hypothetical protein